VLTRARRSAAALALEPHPGSKGQIMTHAQIAELDKHNNGLIRELVEAWVSLFVPQDRRGSSLMTRVAGTTQATAALRISNRLTLAMVTGSFGVTPNVRARTRPPTVIDNTRPQPNPSNAGTKPYFSMNGTSSACLAPSASRTPSSRLRCSTVNRKNRI
jgi:hypothetical protein